MARPHLRFAPLALALLLGAGPLRASEALGFARAHIPVADGKILIK